MTHLRTFALTIRDICGVVVPWIVFLGSMALLVVAITRYPQAAETIIMACIIGFFAIIAIVMVGAMVIAGLAIAWDWLAQRWYENSIITAAPTQPADNSTTHRQVG